MARPKTRNDELKDQVLSESLALLESQGSGAVTARRVASAAGTSTAAVYELFGSKAGLVRSIFFEGFEQLAALLDANEATDDARADLVTLFETTRSFALKFPMLFDVMFARPFAEFEPSASDYDAAKRIYSHVTGLVAALLGSRRGAQATVDAAHMLVALDRGLIASEMSGLLGGSAASVTRRRSIALSAALDGLEAQGAKR